jgi:hypothetical protein
MVVLRSVTTDLANHHRKWRSQVDPFLTNQSFGQAICYDGLFLLALYAFILWVFKHTPKEKNRWVDLAEKAFLYIILIAGVIGVLLGAAIWAGLFR